MATKRGAAGPAAVRAAAQAKEAAKEAAKKLRAYLAALPPGTRKQLQQVRSIVRATAPGAVEVFSYGIPGFKLEGRPLIWYAGWKDHLSLYPMGTTIRRTFAADLAGAGFSKGTIRFPLTAPPSATLLKRLVKARLAELG